MPRRRRERRHRIALLNEMLAPTRVTVREWQGSAYIVSTPTGRSEIAYNLAEIWTTVERVTLLRELLAAESSERTAVLVNEFGEVGSITCRSMPSRRTSCCSTPVASAAGSAAS